VYNKATDIGNTYFKAGHVKHAENGPVACACVIGSKSSVDRRKALSTVFNQSKFVQIIRVGKRQIEASQREGRMEHLLVCKYELHHSIESRIEARSSL